MTRSRQRIVPFTACILTVLSATTTSQAQTGTAGRSVRDCLGSAKVISIRPGRVGQLPLRLSLAEIRHRCPSLAWSTVNGDETLDTAIVITHGALRLVGAVATLGDDEGFHRPVHIDERLPVRWWQVSGTSGTLRRGVAMTATWAQVERAYGPLRAFGLNGTAYVTICREPGITLLMDLPDPVAPINGATPRTVDSVMASVRISAVLVSASAVRRSSRAC